MRKLAPSLLAFLALAAILSGLMAQPPADKQKDYSDSSIVTRMMAFNKKKDGKLTKADVTDTRLHRLFDLADTNKDGIVTREELMTLAAKMDKEWGQGGGKGGKGGPGEKGPKGKGPGGFGAPPQPGQVLPVFLQEMLDLSTDQKNQLDALQKDVDTKLAAILTDEQKSKLRDLRENFGPGGKGKGGLPKN